MTTRTEGGRILLSSSTCWELIFAILRVATVEIEFDEDGFGENEN